MKERTASATTSASGLRIKTLAIYLYEIGFRQFEQGYAAAIGYSLALISIVLAGVQLLLFRRFGDD